MTEKPKLIKGIDIPIRMPSELAAEYEQRIKELEVESANEQERHFRRGYKAAEQELSLKLAEKEQMIKELKGEAKEMAKIAHESVHEHLDEIAEKDKEIEKASVTIKELMKGVISLKLEIASLKKENREIKKLYHAGLTGRLDIQQALSELRDDFTKIMEKIEEKQKFPNTESDETYTLVILDDVKREILKAIDSRRTK